jgi:hypothetical protein
MNKFSITAGTLALDLTTDDARESFLQRCFKNLRFHRTARSKAVPLEGVDSQLIDESRWEPDKHQPPIYYLATMHPHLVAASLFSRKPR